MGKQVKPPGEKNMAAIVAIWISQLNYFVQLAHAASAEPWKMSA